MTISPIFSYGRRTGVTSLKRIVKALCVLFHEFEPTIRTWVSDQMSGEDAAVINGWLDSIDAVCLIIEATPDD